MNDIISAVRARALANADYAAITTRFYDGCALESAKLPFTVAKILESTSATHMGGTSGFVNVKVELNHYAAFKNSDAAVAMEKHARTALDGYSGTVTIATGQTFTIRACALVGGGSETLSNEQTGELTTKHSQTFDIWHNT